MLPWGAFAMTDHNPSSPSQSISSFCFPTQIECSGGFGNSEKGRSDIPVLQIMKIIHS